MTYLYLLAAEIIPGVDLNVPEPAGVENTSFIGALLPTVFLVLGALSVIFIIIGGFRFAISGGDPNNIKTARETILYALVGLVVSLLAFTIVNFILENINPDEGGAAIVGPGGVLTQAAQLLVYAVGVVSVIMIIIGAIRFIVSGGDPNATKTARDTVLYAIIGLIVAIISQGIVTFILGAF